MAEFSISGISSSPGVPAPGPYKPPQGGALSSSQGLDLIGGLLKNQQMIKELQGRQALGNAYQGALNPDGSLEPERLAAGLKDPAASWLLPEAMSHIQTQLGSQFDRLKSQNQFVSDSFGALADKPNLSAEDIRNWVTTAARSSGIPPAILEMWKSNVLAGNPGSSELRNRLQTSRSMAIGSSGLAGRDTGPPTEAGAPTTISRGQSVFGGPGGIATGQPPGASTLQEASAAGAAALEGTGPKTNQIHADLENLRQLNKDIPLQGPTAEFEKKLNQVGARLGIGVTMTAGQLAKSEEFDKIANQLSLNQSTLFHGSDAGLHTTIAANPNLGMSRYGREGVIDMLQGNQDAIDRTRQLWFDARRRGATANSYNDFINQSSKAIDPRVFQFNRMSAENQKKFAQDMDSADVDEFKRKYRRAVENGWVKPPKTDKKATAE